MFFSRSASIDLAYGEDPLQRLDLLLSDVPGGPLLVFVHGGAWQSGSRHEYDGAAVRMREAGLAVASVDYRLSPAVQHPTHAQDVARALGWLVERAPEYGYDPHRITVVGHSAGAHLAATLANEATSPEVAAFVGLEGIYDPHTLAARWPTYPDWFLNKAFGADAARWPRLEAPSSRAPWLLVHSEADELVDTGQTDAFATRLRAAGVSVEVLKPLEGSHDGIVAALAEADDPVGEAILRIAHRSSQRR